MADTKDAACTKYLVQGIRHGNACEAYGKFENTTKMKERIQGGSLLLKKEMFMNFLEAPPSPPKKKRESFVQLLSKNPQAVRVTTYYQAFRNSGFA